jgi:hypothetical protein
MSQDPRKRVILRIDAGKDHFVGAGDENRIEFSIGRDLNLNPKQEESHLTYLACRLKRRQYNLLALKRSGF